MADIGRLSRPVVIELPREIDATTAEEATEPLRAACAHGAVVIADMALTTFCDARGTQELLNAQYSAKAASCEMRVARPSAEVLRVWMLLGIERIFAIYPTLEGARVVDGVPQRKLRFSYLLKLRTDKEG